MHRKSARLPVFKLIERLPRDEHRHHDGLARAGRHLQRQAREARVGRVVRGAQIVFDPRVSVLSRDFRDVDGCLDGFNLTEEQGLVPLLASPVPEQA